MDIIPPHGLGCIISGPLTQLPSGWDFPRQGQINSVGPERARLHI